jgi:predicted 3-demethylubiquinone-9 3-methyltransferase (glyoxalase superfamily)
MPARQNRAAMARHRDFEADHRLHGNLGTERMSTMTDKIRMATCLWFNKNAEEAARFYAATFPDSRVTAVHKSPADYPSGKAGDVLTVEFTVLGQPFLGLNGGPEFTFDEAISFQVYTDTQEETDRYWNAIVGAGGQESMCGWCKDRFGLSWQITPRALMAAINDPDTAAAKRAMEAMMTMKNIDIARIEEARAGRAHAVR